MFAKLFNMKDISTVINEPDINSLYSHISQYLQDLSMYNDEKKDESYI